MRYLLWAVKRELLGNVYRKIGVAYILVLVVSIFVLKISVSASPVDHPINLKNDRNTTSQMQSVQEADSSGETQQSAEKTRTTVANSKNSQSSSTSSGDSPSSEPSNQDSQDNSNDDDSNDSEPSHTPTSQPTTESASAYVAFYADSQSDTDEEDARHQKVVNKILSSGANPIFHGGDVMEDGTQNSLDRFNAVTSTLRATRSFYSVLGNNDRKIGDSSTPSQLFLDNFSFPNNEMWYSINTGNLHMVFLDSAFCASCQSQIDWLVSDLQSSASQSRITGVIYHHPSFSSTLSSYLESNGVDFVIQGHEHVYRHTLSGGINYFVMPGGGSLGYALASIYPSKVAITFFNENGGAIDSASFNER